ncbi:sulfur carrier protein ThiS [Pedobacter duraquae]|uniref:Sulfur carrier protein ThiS n=1 Tax=Pedobacter duraquae TaxID=425511 RepID=A0A4R6IQ52_9SPHI|nr:sulfur carrier protein ThiS [Pedobacter duraquae]TDO24464.1 sulfur carrier protein ThiS [Pedobacter duraquae]
MEITVNHQTYQVTDVCSIEQMLNVVLPLSQSGIAVAINEVIIPKKSWSSELIKSNDQILIIRATQGG